MAKTARLFKEAWIHFGLIMVLMLSLVRPFSSEAQGRPATPTCTDYSALTQDQQVTVAYGYLEGVQAALDKDPVDVLVPTSDAQHPMWWVVPKMASDPFTELAGKLAAHCKSADRNKAILDAFLAIAYQKEGWPSLGISYDKKKTDPWERFLGGSVSCSGYNASPPGTRQSMIYGYRLGTEALRVALKSSVNNEIVWPSKLTVEAVRDEVDKGCQKGGTWRDVMWLTTVELAVKSGGGRSPSKKK